MESLGEVKTEKQTKSHMIEELTEKKALDPEEECEHWAEQSLDKDRWKIIEFWTLGWG